MQIVICLAQYLTASRISFINKHLRLFSFRNLSLDLNAVSEAWKLKYKILRHSDDVKFEGMLITCYLNAKAYQPLTEFLLKERTGKHPLFEKVIAKRLLENDGHLYLKLLWEQYLSGDRASYRQHVKIFKKYKDGEVPPALKRYNFKNEMLREKAVLSRSLALCMADMLAMGDLTSYEKLKKELNTLEEGSDLAGAKRSSSKKIGPNFWGIIQRSKSAPTIELQISMIQALVDESDPDSILRFHKFIKERYYELYTWELWALGFIALGGCTEEDFDDFRCWIILQGSDFFNQIRSESTNTSLDVSNARQGSGLLQVCKLAYWEKVGSELPEAEYEHVIQGEPWDEVDLPTKYRHLVIKYNYPTRQGL